MSNLAQLEASFQRYVSDLERWVPDGITEINLVLLQRLELIDTLENDSVEGGANLTQYFHVIEAPEKITLFNEEFVIWIVPEVHENRAVTYALISKISEENTSLEVVVSATGVYNSSRTVLRVMDKILHEIIQTDQELDQLKNA